jgi:threonine dehydratase
VVTTMAGITLGSIMAARRDIAGGAIEALLVPSPYLSSVVGQKIFLKLEITQPADIFKVCGLANDIFNLSAETASTTRLRRSSEKARVMKVSLMLQPSR